MVADKEAFPEGPEHVFVSSCHEAWRRRMGQLKERARREGLGFPDLVNREFERLRVRCSMRCGGRRRRPFFARRSQATCSRREHFCAWSHDCTSFASSVIRATSSLASTDANQAATGRISVVGGGLTGQRRKSKTILASSCSVTRIWLRIPIAYRHDSLSECHSSPQPRASANSTTVLDHPSNPRWH